jgi:WD40 repeat protein
VKCTLSGHSRPVSCLAFKPGDPNILVTGSWDKTLKIWDLSTAASACLSTVNVDSYVFSVAFSPCGKTMAVGCENGTVVIVDVATVAEMRSLSGHSDW